MLYKIFFDYRSLAGNDIFTNYPYLLYTFTFMKNNFKQFLVIKALVVLFFIAVTGCEKKPPETIPVITTAAVTDMTKNSAVSGGEITSDGGSPVTARGVCWSTDSNPSLDDSFTADGAGTGTFPSNITGLNPGTTYYIRSYATNSIGTAYGNELTFSTNPLAVGDEHQGGKIAYILNQGDPGYVSGEIHGIIAAPADLPDLYQWYNGSLDITGATATALGSGNANTNTIVTVQGNGTYAAKACYDLVLGGYSDWYLPSQDELHMMFLNRNLIGGFDATYDVYYWTSSEYDSGMSFMETFFFSDGYRGFQAKHVPLKVRPVRSF